MNSPMLSSKLTALETKIFGKMMVVTSYFKDEVQSLKKYYHASNWSMRNSAAERDSTKKLKPEGSSIFYEASPILPFSPRSLLLYQKTLSKYWIFAASTEF